MTGNAPRHRTRVQLSKIICGITLFLQVGAGGAGDQRDCSPLLAALEAGAIRSVNGLAPGGDCREVYVTARRDSADGRVAIARYVLEDGRWVVTPPVFDEHDYDDYQPTLSPDGSLLLFTSTRPVARGGEASRQNVWFSRRAGDGAWGSPVVVPEIAGSAWDGHARLTRSDSLYFASDRPGGAGGTDIYRGEFRDGRVHNVEPVAAVNSALSESDIYVDPDESYLVLTRYSEETGDLDLYVADNINGEWQVPRKIPGASSPEWELSPQVLPGGHTLVFMQGKDGDFASLAVTTIRKAGRSRRGTEITGHQ